MALLLNKFEKYGFLLTSLLFLALYVLLSFNNRLTSDDYDFFSLVNENGWAGAIKYMYFNWSGRWASIAYFYAVLSSSSNLANLSGYLFLYHFLSIALFIYAVYSIITSLFSYFFTEIQSKVSRLTYAIIFCASVYFSTFQNAEVWFWVCSSFCYLQMLIFACLGVSLLLSKKIFLFKNVLIAICFIFLGGSLETFSLSLLIIFSVLLFILARKQDFRIKALLKDTFFKSFIIAFSFLLISSCLNYFAPGNFKRKQHELVFVKENKEFNPSTDHTKSVKKNSGMANSPTEIFKIMLSKKYLVFYLLLMPWLILGVNMKFASKRKTEINFSLNKIALLSVALLLLIFTINAFTSLIIYGNYGPLRSWMSLSFLFAIILCFWFFVLGYNLPVFTKYKSTFSFLCVCGLIVTMCYYVYKQYPLVTNYSMAYDMRINYLNKLKQNNIKDTLIILKPLPDAGMLVGDNIVGIENALDLKFKVMVQEN